MAKQAFFLATIGIILPLLADFILPAFLLYNGHVNVRLRSGNDLLDTEHFELEVDNNSRSPGRDWRKGH